MCHKERASETHLLLGSGKFSLISCFFFEHRFVVWPNLGLRFVSAKLYSELVMASRDPGPLAIPLWPLHSTGAVTLVLGNRNLGKVKLSLGRACEAVRHKNTGDIRVSDIKIRVWYLQQTQNLYMLLIKWSINTFPICCIHSLLNEPFIPCLHRPREKINSCSSYIWAAAKNYGDGNQWKQPAN